MRGKPWYKGNHIEWDHFARPSLGKGEV
ncbi:hypothetical protein EMEDMD4_1060054 [Sinorhizobium medicae]|uniref:Uncharacterized protein n=1 Tax=Sinorhizobium medicae TaxID=110321 RepID=A0A508WPY3_9HYPH|nr:hypothetical protein EMEDMD4_1060054 [Sinorhizobium medicae]